jgi:hypothetical protein
MLIVTEEILGGLLRVVCIGFTIRSFDKTGGLGNNFDKQIQIKQHSPFI